MIVVFLLLVLLITAAPVLTIVNGVISLGLPLLITAAAIVLILLTSPVGQFRRLATLWRPIAPIALVPCFWMLVQIVPAPAWLAHPAWMSASAALGEPLVGAITVDIGATSLALGQYVLALAIAVIATAVTLDRRRAEAILFILTYAAGSVAAIWIGLEFGLLRFVGLDLSAQRPQMLTIAVIGFVLACTTTLHTYENLRRHREAHATTASTTIAAIGSFMVMAISVSEIALNADPALLLAAASGLLVLIGLAITYHLRLGPWGQSGIIAAAAVGLIGFFAAIPAKGGADLALVLSSQPQASIATAERMLSDARWLGTGAGTFAVLSPIYRDIDSANVDIAPTAAASVAIEMGRPSLWLFVSVALVGALTLIKRALTRGREYYYAGAGAACVVAVLVASFANVGILSVAASLLTSAVCGLALAQSRSWNV